MLLMKNLSLFRDYNHLWRFELTMSWNGTVHVHLQALTWGKDMVAMSGSGPGYVQTIIITPYIDSMIFHVPEMMRKQGSLRFFSGQGVCSFIVLSKHTNSGEHVSQKCVPKHESMSKHKGNSKNDKLNLVELANQKRVSVSCLNNFCFKLDFTFCTYGIV